MCAGVLRDVDDAGRWRLLGRLGALRRWPPRQAVVVLGRTPHCASHVHDATTTAAAASTSHAALRFRGDGDGSNGMQRTWRTRRPPLVPPLPLDLGQLRRFYGDGRSFAAAPLLRPVILPRRQPTNQSLFSFPFPIPTFPFPIPMLPLLLLSPRGARFYCGRHLLLHTLPPELILRAGL